MAVSDASVSEITQFNLTPIAQSKELDSKILGFYVDSTAPINVEDPPNLPQASVLSQLREIARYLVASDDPQIVISIHGYGTQKSDAEKRYEKIYEYAAKLCSPRTSVFFGYHWPSEKPSGDRSMKTGDPPVPDVFPIKIKNAFNALPYLPAWLFWGGLFLSITVSLLLLTTSYPNWILVPILFISVLAFSIHLALILLRLSNYFRDNYRATNFGVLDLIELIRQLDLAIAEEDTTGRLVNSNTKVKLSFMGHSMGCFVVTNAIRILSDVFDPCSVEKKPLSDIGRVFCLERLILIAPDIPVETVIPRRANFLRSSLRRCKEAYIFASEGDLAVRLASTAANYFSFPGRTRLSGYRLGNLAVKRFKNEGDRTQRKLQDQDYGIVNRQGDTIERPYYWLEIRSSSERHQTLYEIRSLDEIEKENLNRVQDIPVSDLFTYFDCTDYVDVQGKPDGTAPQGSAQGVVTYALRKSALNLMDYGALCLAYFFNWTRSINVHGGYFDGMFSQQLMYKLAFLGFTGLLTSVDGSSSPPDSLQAQSPEVKKKLLDQLSNQCQEKGIQVVLAPIRYQEDILK